MPTVAEIGQGLYGDEDYAATLDQQPAKVADIGAKVYEQPAKFTPEQYQAAQATTFPAPADEGFTNISQEGTDILGGQAAQAQAAVDTQGAAMDAKAQNQKDAVWGNTPEDQRHGVNTTDIPQREHALTKAVEVLGPGASMSAVMRYTGITHLTQNDVATWEGLKANREAALKSGKIGLPTEGGFAPNADKDQTPVGQLLRAIPTSPLRSVAGGVLKAGAKAVGTLGSVYDAAVGPMDQSKIWNENALGPGGALQQAGDQTVRTINSDLTQDNAGSSKTVQYLSEGLDMAADAITTAAVSGPAALPLMASEAMRSASDAADQAGVTGAARNLYVGTSGLLAAFGGQVAQRALGGIAGEGGEALANRLISKASALEAVKAVGKEAASLGVMNFGDLFVAAASGVDDRGLTLKGWIDTGKQTLRDALILKMAGSADRIVKRGASDIRVPAGVQDEANAQNDIHDAVAKINTDTPTDLKPDETLRGNEIVPENKAPTSGLPPEEFEKTINSIQHPDQPVLDQFGLGAVNAEGKVDGGAETHVPGEKDATPVNERDFTKQTSPSLDELFSDFEEHAKAKGLTDSGVQREAANADVELTYPGGEKVNVKGIDTAKAEIENAKRNTDDNGSAAQGSGIREGVPASRDASGPENASAGEKGVDGQESVKSPPQAQETPSKAVPEQDADLTGIKNEAVNEFRKSLGKESVQNATPETNAAQVQRAIEQNRRDPASTDKLIEELKSKPRALKPEETFQLQMREVDLKQNYRDAMREWQSAFDSGDKAKTSELFQKASEHSNKLDDLEIIAKQAGTESGRSLQARQRMMAEDYSLANMVRNKTAAKGRALTPEEHAVVMDQNKRIDTLMAKVKELESKSGSDVIKTLEAEAGKKPARKFTPRNAETTFTGKIRQALTERAAAARLRLKDAGKKVRGGFVPVSPGELADAAIVGAHLAVETGFKLKDWSAKIITDLGERFQPHLDELWNRAKAHLSVYSAKAALAEGGDKAAETRNIRELFKGLYNSGEWKPGGSIEDAVKMLHEHYKEVNSKITPEEVRDALSGIGQYKPLSKDALSVERRDLQQQALALGKIESIQKGKLPPKTGMEYQEKSEEGRRLNKQYQEILKNSDIKESDPETQLKSALQSKKTYYENRLKDMQHEIDTKELIAKKESRVHTSPEVEALKAEYEKVKGEHAATFESGKSYEEQVGAAEKQAIKSLAEWEQKAKDAKQGLFSKKKEGPEVGSDARQHALDKIEALKAEVELYRKGREYSAVPMDERTIAAEAQAAKAKADAENKLNAAQRGFFGGKGKKEGPAVGSEAAQATLEETQALREQAKPLMAMQAAKARIAARQAELSEKIAKGDFSKTDRPEAATSPELEQARTELRKTQAEYKLGVQRDALAHRTGYEKFADGWHAIQRFMLLTGVKTLGKLGSAAASRTLVQTPLEEVGGGVISKALPRLAEKAQREGGLNLDALAKSITQGAVKGFKEIPNVLKTGQSEQEILHGKPRVSPEGKLYTVAEAPGRVHQAEKTPTKYAEIELSTRKRIAALQKAGVDVNDPLVQAKLKLDAYKDGERAAFGQDNVFADKFNQTMREWQKSDNPAAKAASLVGRTLLPITKIPSNFLAETANLVAGLPIGGARAALAYKNGIEKLAPEQADSIMRQMKKGLVGAGFVALGYAMPNMFGGFYQPHSKKNEDEADFMGAKVGGKKISPFLLHNPLIYAAQFGATLRKVADSWSKASDAPRGLIEGTVEASLGLAEESPFVKETLDLAKMRESDKALQHGLGNLGRRMFIPRAVQEGAQLQDEQGEKYKARSYTDEAKLGLPWLRQKVGK